MVGVLPVDRCCHRTTKIWFFTSPQGLPFGSAIGDPEVGQRQTSAGSRSGDPAGTKMKNLCHKNVVVGKLAESIPSD